MLTPTIKENLKHNADWVALKEFIVSSCEDLVTISDIDFLNKQSAAIEGRARQLALSKLQLILEPFLEEEPITIDKTEEAMKRVGLD